MQLSKSISRSLSRSIARGISGGGGEIAPYIALKCGAGLFDFSWNNPNCRKWVFPDGSISYDERPTRTLSAPGIVYLYCDDFSGNYRLSDNDTDSNYLGKLADLQGKITYYLSLYKCVLVKGSLADFQGKITNTLGVNDCNLIKGSLADLQGKITNYLGLNNCNLIKGSLADLQGKITNYLGLNNCNLVTGVYTPSGTALPTITYLSYTGVSTADMDATLNNYAAQAVAINKVNGAFSGFGITRTAASDDAIATLTGLGWTVSGLTKN